MSQSNTPLIPFGKQFREKYFNFDTNFIPLNHGSFGATPKPVAEYQLQVMKEYMKNPDKYLRFTMVELLEKALASIAPYLGILPKDSKNYVFVENATSGVNTVLRSYPFKKGDAIIYCSTTYGACSSSALFIKELMGVETSVVNLTYPISGEEICKMYKDEIDRLKKENPNRTILALFDAVSSQPACKLPWKKLVKICTENEVLSLVDGAHGIGLLTDLDLSNVRPDFFVTNLHKWFFTPTSAAVLYVDPKHHRVIQTFPISHSYQSSVVTEYTSTRNEKNLLRDKFFFVGTLNYSPYISVTEAVKFRQEVCGGEQAIKDYTYKLALEAAELFAREFDTEILKSTVETNDDDISTSMINVFLPTPSGPKIAGTNQVDIEFAMNELQYSMLQEDDVYFPISCHNGKLYTRLSAQVYLDIDDFKKGLELFKARLKKYEEAYDDK